MTLPVFTQEDAAFLKANYPKHLDAISTGMSVYVCQRLYKQASQMSSPYKVNGGLTFENCFHKQEYTNFVSPVILISKNGSALRPRPIWLD